ncbi:unnamed protein product [Closterium sp. NIES-54]
MAATRPSDAVRSCYPPFPRKDSRCPSTSASGSNQPHHQLRKAMESRLAASSGAVSSNRACDKVALVSSTSQSSSAPSSSPRVIPKSRSSGALLASCPIPFKAGVSPLAPPAESSMTASSSLSGNQTVATDPFSRLPDDVVIEILSHLGGGAPDVLAASMTCRRWQSFTRSIPVLRFVPRDTSRAGGSDCASTLPACSAIQREELVSRMVLKSAGLQQLQVTSSLLPPPTATAFPARSASSPCDHGGDCACSGSAEFTPQQQQQQQEQHQQHPREFIFEAWMRHAGPQLQSLVLSRSLNAAANGGGSTTINVWENEDLSLHLGHISRHCKSLRSLTLGSLSLAAPALESCLRPMPNLQDLSLSWIHLTNECLQMILDATPNLRRLTIFMATGCPQISLRLPASLEHVDFAYLRAESCAFITASSLRSVSIRDMFVRSVTIQQAPRLRYFAIASASLLEVSAPESCEITTLDLKAGSFCWSSLQSLLRGCGTALNSLALDFFTAGSGALSSGVFSLFWLAAMCPALRALNLGSLPWQLVLSWATTSGALQPAGSAVGSAARWPQLEELKLKVQEQRPEALLLLHALLSNVPTLKSLQVATAVEEEGEEEEEEEEEDEEEEDEEFEEFEEEDEECDDEYEEEEVEEYEAEDEDDLMEVEEGAESSDEYDDKDESMPVRSGKPAVQRHMSRQELFLKGLVCLQQRFSDVNWHDTLRTTLAALRFAPSTADPSLYLRTDTSLPPFYVLVYVDDLVFATADTEALALVKSELQNRHTCTDLGELRSYLGLQITRDRARRTITPTQSHMVQQVLQRFGFTYSSPQSTPLPTGHSLSAPPSDESVEPSGPYIELVGCLMYVMTCTRPDLAYPLGLLARYVAPGRHRKVHMDAAKRVLRYLCSTSCVPVLLTFSSACTPSGD